MRIVITFCILSLFGCVAKFQQRMEEKKFKSSIPAAPGGASACTLAGEKTIDAGLQTKNPIALATVASGKTYHLVWSRAEAIDIPEETPSTQPSTEIGSLHVAKFALTSKTAPDIEKISSERSGTSKISVTQQGSTYSYFFEDEFGVHLSQRANNKPTGLTFDIAGARSPNIVNTKSGLWTFWTSSCEGGGEIKMLKLAKDATPEAATKQSADGILCGRASLAAAASGNQVALAWIVKGFLDKKGRLVDNQIAVMFGDVSKGSFSKPILITPAPGDPDKNPVAGPALSLSADGKEASVAWIIEGKAIAFATISSEGKTTIKPQLLPASYKAKELASSIVSDKEHHSIAWSDGDDITLSILNKQGAMATAPLKVGPGIRPTLINGFSTKEKEYSIFYWRPTTSNSTTSKTLAHQQANCFAKPKKTKKPKK